MDVKIKYRPKLISYLKVGKLLHLITIIEIAAIILLLPELLSIVNEPISLMLVVKICLVLYLIWLPLSAQLDARSRFQNYKKIKDQLYLNGYQHRILKPVLKSRCQRDAAKVAANELGYMKNCCQYFKSHGYKWYHVLPDWLFRSPQYLFSSFFVRTTFFAPTYHSKINYKEVILQPELTVLSSRYYERAS